MTRNRTKAIAVLLGACGGAAALSTIGTSSAPARPATRTVTLAISGGHQTKAVDNGRPVVLVAAALGVPETVFRKAFSGVSPAAGGTEPDPAQVDRNKQALLDVLSPYGVTNDELDRVSNHYRYVPGSGTTWPGTRAIVKATISGTRIVRVTIVRAGSGYSSPPTLRVPGLPGVRLGTTLGFSTDFAKNGRIASARGGLSPISK
jgi:hypothetical protein